MDALKAEIASKRKALDNAPPRPNKYMRRGDIERMKEEEEREAREEAAKKAEEAQAQKAAQPKVRSATPLRKYTQNDIETSLELRIPKQVAPCP
jgi:pre-mRNA-splicing factor 18